MKTMRIVLGLSLLLLATNAFGQKVTTDSVPNTDWSKYHTYSWGEGTPAQDPITAQRIVAGIDSQLAAKGLKKVDADPDLVVIYHTSTAQQKSLNWSSMGGFGRFGGMGSAQVDTVINGQLKVDIADYKAKQFLWRGTATDTVSDNPQKVAKTLNKALTKMFQKFPPPPGQ
ncbi:MAG TPA: DUF4136 domain-containing protein [Pyrinomonadaceae bacterium]|nr:DUF4136 domain-containing protein [Pyrinomonadaceae bacterium]